MKRLIDAIIKKWFCCHEWEYLFERRVEVVDDWGDRSWRIPTLQESVLGYEHKVMLNAALAICGKQPVKDDWYWCSTRKGNKRNFILSWGDGFRYDNIQDSDDWVRPVSAASLNSL